MITLAIILLIVGVFIARHILWPIAGILLVVGLLLWVLGHTAYPAYY